jgi:hypothetical protein
VVQLNAQSMDSFIPPFNYVAMAAGWKAAWAGLPANSGEAVYYREAEKFWWTFGWIQGERAIRSMPMTTQ